jgi:hypothetical protein
MANPTESVEKYATAVLSGSLMALALLLAADGQFGGLFTTLGKVHVPDTWSFVAIVPTLAVIYALGLIVTTGSAFRYGRHWLGSRS